jgi:ribose transport system ATP-binding protein
MSIVSPLLEVRGVSKTFGRYTVLRDLQLTIAPGEVHALAGHNGSGKSTFVKLLAGFHQPDPGAHAQLAGEPFAIGSASAADTAGLRFVHQDLGLIDTLSAVDNVYLGSEYPTRWGGRIDWVRARDHTNETLASLGLHFDPTREAASLSATQRTGLAIARAIHPRQTPARAIILDEPTAALPANEVKSLSDVIGRLRARGLGILYISHHLEELFALADRVTVLRDGQTVSQGRMGDLDEPRLVSLMVGEQMASHPRRARRSASAGAPVLEVEALATRTLRSVDFTLRSGVILGIAGIDGSGRDELASAVFGGIDRGGEVKLDGHVLPALRPDLSVAAGAGLVPSDRMRDAALAGLSVSENLSIARITSRLRGLMLDHRALRVESEAWVQRLNITPRQPTATIATLSGGNQQKVIVARWLRLAPRLLILDEPTKGVDIAAVARIWGLVRDAATEGTAVIACSSDAEELAANCDRVLVLQHGRITAELTGDQLSADEIDARILSNDTAGDPWPQ